MTHLTLLHFISTAVSLYDDLFLVGEQLKYCSTLLVVVTRRDIFLSGEGNLLRKIPRTKLELLGNDYLIGANSELQMISTGVETSARGEPVLDHNVKKGRGELTAQCAAFAVEAAGAASGGRQGQRTRPGSRAKGPLLHHLQRRRACAARAHMSARRGHCARAAYS